MRPVAMRSRGRAVIYNFMHCLSSTLHFLSRKHPLPTEEIQAAHMSTVRSFESRGI